MALAPPLVSAADFALFLRTTYSEGQEAQATLILQVVSAWARTVGKTAWNDTDQLPPDDVVGVVLSAARREWLNPDRIITEAMGPISVTRAAPPPGFFSPGELQILKKKSSGALYTIGTRREECGWGVGYLHMNEQLSDEPFPYLNYGEPGWKDTLHE
ncbi:hypothetical protein MINTM005_13260 [Mycobacterium intracellulare]|uniref:hypothetical protein n=1 Tax=Mycobacterium intracellulare TaxID=1767 RepID=UPI001928E889|nr:hypothetical protein [Mycobacterium intracellulare]BCO56082.1 hypothetical protein MINTM005_13260 [Mycobacterium intracellulare]